MSLVQKSFPTPLVFLEGFLAVSPTTPSFTLSSSYTALFSVPAFHVKLLSASRPLKSISPLDCQLYKSRDHDCFYLSL